MGSGPSKSCERCGRYKTRNRFCGRCRYRIEVQGLRPEGDQRHITQRGAGNPAWKGGRHTDSHGYVWVHPNPNDPIDMAMVGSKGYVQEHRLIMAHYLDRALTRAEPVHHINGVKDDNRIENLKLFSSRGEHHRNLHLERCPNCGFHLRAVE